MRRVAAADDFALNDFFLRLAVEPIGHLKINRLPLEQREQQLLRNRIVAIILLKDLQRMFAARVAQNHRVRLDVRGCVGVADVVDAGLQIERHGVAHDGKILVVNGERRASMVSKVDVVFILVWLLFKS